MGTDVESGPAISCGDRLASAVARLTAELNPAAVLLFGSHAAGRSKDDSDVDLAIVMGAAPPDFDALARLKVDLEAILRAAVDLVILDTASPILVMEVLRSHRLLAARDPEALERLIVRCLTDYADLKRVRRPIEEALLASRS